MVHLATGFLSGSSIIVIFCTCAFSFGGSFYIYVFVFSERVNVVYVYILLGVCVYVCSIEYPPSTSIVFFAFSPIDIAGRIVWRVAESHSRSDDGIVFVFVYVV